MTVRGLGLLTRAVYLVYGVDSMYWNVHNSYGY